MGAKGIHMHACEVAVAAVLASIGLIARAV